MNLTDRIKGQQTSQRTIFNSEIVKNIEIYQKKIKVTTVDGASTQIPYTGEGIFNAYFNSMYFKSLEALTFQRCKLKVLPKINAPLLNKLCINHQSGLSLSQFASQPFQSLKSIRISSKQMVDLPEFHAIGLEKIQVSCSFKNLTVNDFCKGNYPKLIEIQFINNVISNELEFKNFPQLQILNIRSNNMNSLASLTTGNFPSLKIINGTANQIKDLPSFSNCPLIQVLDLSHNQIQNIQLFSNTNHSNLKRLLLNFNHIKQLPSINAQNLESLELNDNYISSIRKFDLNKYQKLRHIGLSNNKLTEIPFINAPNLEQLSVFGNKIKDFSNFYFGTHAKYQELRRFLCSRNLIVAIPTFLTFPNFRHLMQLDISKCGILNAEILSQIQLDKIEVINLAENKIYSFNFFHKLILPSIQCIRLDGNLSTEKSIMSKCRIGRNQNNKYQKFVSIYEDIHGGGHNLNWIFKQFQKGIKFDFRINYQRSIELNVKLNQALNRKLMMEYF